MTSLPAFRLPEPLAVLLLSLALVAGCRQGASAASPVALELVLAVDCSSSVNAEEYALQMVGIAEAFRSPPVIAAIHSAGAGGVAVTLVQWAGGRMHRQAVAWTLLDGPAASLALADAIEATPRLFQNGATAIGDAMEYSTALIESNDYVGLRKVVDVSGDGIANQGQSPGRARAGLMKLGITVNGLAILNEEPRLGRYYLAGVVGGPGGFMLTAADYHDFRAAILLKLIHEIGGPTVAGRPGPERLARAQRP